MENLIYFFKMNKLKITLYSSLALTLLVACLSFITINNKYQNEDSEMKIEPISALSENEEAKPETEVTKETIKIDIKGEIENPGVYELLIGSRVIDVIEKSGGFTKNAYVECINLSKKLTDEDMIIIPSVEKNYMSTNKTCTISNTESESTNKTDELNTFVNINTATKEVLMSLNGIGESKAIKIIEYRTENGNFKTKEEIKNVNGIGETIYEKIKDNITV